MTEAIPPQHGALSIDPITGAVTYTPETGYSGPDTYTVNVCDTAAPPECTDVTVAVTVQPIADLAVTKDLTIEQVVAGLPVSYDVKLTNNGPSTAADVHSVDPIPAAILDPIGTPDPAIAGASCQTRPTAAADLDRLDPAYGPYTLASHPLVVDCTYPQLSSGTTVHDTISGIVDPALLAGTTVVNQVAVYSADYDPDLEDNLAAASAVSVATAVPPIVAGLGRTGVAVSGWVAGASLLLLTGAGIVLLARRRQANHEH